MRLRGGEGNNAENSSVMTIPVLQFFVFISEFFSDNLIKKNIFFIR